MRPLFWLSTIAQESQQSASRGRVLAFYRIAPCLINPVQSKNRARPMAARLIKAHRFRKRHSFIQLELAGNLKTLFEFRNVNREDGFFH